MRTPQFFFFRGSTPTLELGLPYGLGEADPAFLSLSQGGNVVLEYARNGPQSVAEGSLESSAEDPSRLLLRMTQADSLRLAAGDCELQLRVRTGTEAETFCPLFGQIGETRKEGVI